MTFYQEEVLRIKQECYANQWQIDTVIGIRNYINQNYDQDLNLDVLSHIRFISKFHLLRLYKRYYGQTPKQYLTEKRIEKAKEFLRSGLSVTETCFAVGFESTSSFSALFKKRTGFTPSHYRKEQFSRSK